MAEETPWVPVGAGRYVGTPVNPRYPTYTRGNAGEVFPEVIYPLTFSTLLRRCDQAWQRAVQASGAFRPAELAGQPSVTLGVFGGYCYLNLSFMRAVVRRTPGGRIEALDAAVLGTAPSPPYRSVRGDRSLSATLRGVAPLVRTLRGHGLPDLDADVARVVTWEASVGALATVDEARLSVLLAEANDLGTELFEHHLAIMGPAMLAGRIVELCRDHLHDEGLGLRLIAGLGSVESADPSWAMWDLGRAAGADAHVAAHFRLGTEGLWARLGADAACTPFVRLVEAFLAAHGSRGPNEWETACPTWGTEPDLALALIDRMRVAPAAFDPRARHRAAVADREVARREAAARATPLVRLQLRFLLDRAARFLQARERSKTTIVRAIHGARLVLLELGRRTAEAARAAGVAHAAVDDIWFVVAEELDDYLTRPASYALLIAERRAQRSALSERIPPFVFEGAPPPWETWPRRHAASGEGGGPSGVVAAAVGDVLRGLAGSPGVVRGPVRVVHHPGDVADLAPGDVVVAPITDPSWTPLFVPAAAVVVDVGALLSHAVIVARELAIPAVVSVAQATARLHSGDLVEVDGNRGTVTVLACAAGTAGAAGAAGAPQPAGRRALDGSAAGTATLAPGRSTAGRRGPAAG